MTEMTSQFYDGTLRAAIAGPGVSAADLAPPRLKVGPPWVRALVVDVHTLEPLPPGRPGVLRIVDLANRGSVAALLTEDRAVAEDSAAATPEANGRLRAFPFRLLGRARGSEPRGCSLDAEVFA